MTHKLYEVLGVPKDASKEDIKRAFRKLAVQHHPDKGGDPEKFKEIAHAYEVLNDDQKRNEYDHLGDEGLAMHQGGGAGFEHMDPRHIFEQFFGGGSMFGGDMFGGMHSPQPSRVRRNDHMHAIRLSLQEAYQGITKHMRICVSKTCMRCKETCPACQGRGNITDMRRMGFFTQVMTRPCDVCHGTGQKSRGREDCSECKGKATYQEEKRVEVVIPPGVHHGHQIRMDGLGEQPKMDGDIAGDLVLQVVVSSQDSHFRRNGDDLLHTISCTFAEAVIGKRVSIPHYGGAFDVDTSEYGIIQPDKTYIIPDKGMPMLDGRGYGKLQLQFQVHYPQNKFTAEEKARLTECFASLGIV